MEVNMAEKKKIHCRVCGNLFEPCAYCQSHDGVFRWRNFACSIECATKYINDTIAYRESLKKKEEENKSEIKSNDELIEKATTARKRATKKSPTDFVENEKTV